MNAFSAENKTMVNTIERESFEDYAATHPRWAYLAMKWNLIDS